MEIPQINDLLVHICAILFFVFCIVSIAAICIVDGYKAAMQDKRNKDLRCLLEESLNLLRENYKSLSETKTIIAYCDEQGRITYSTLDIREGVDGCEKEADNGPVKSN